MALCLHHWDIPVCVLRFGTHVSGGDAASRSLRVNNPTTFGKWQLPTMLQVFLDAQLFSERFPELRRGLNTDHVCLLVFALVSIRSLLGPLKLSLSKLYNLNSTRHSLGLGDI